MKFLYFREATINITPTPTVFPDWRALIDPLTITSSLKPCRVRGAGRNISLIYDVHRMSASGSVAVIQTNSSLTAALVR